MISPDELAAFADGQLDAARHEEVAAMVAADPALGAQVASHRALRQRLSAHFAPVLEQPVPGRLTAAVRPGGEVVDLAAARNRRRLPAWTRWGAPALAACLAVAVFVGTRGPGSTAPGYANVQLASTLDTQLSAERGETRILLSFRDGAGHYCRAFAAAAQSGIACRDASGWKLHEVTGGSPSHDSEYRQAGANDGDLMAAAQDMAAGPALDAGEEAAARAAGWQAGT